MEAKYFVGAPGLGRVSGVGASCLPENKAGAVGFALPPPMYNACGARSAILTNRPHALSSATALQCRRTHRVRMQVGTETNAATEDAGETEIDAAAREVSASTLKSELLGVVNGTNRGIDATRTVKANAVELIKQLDGKGESFTGSGGAELLVGTWRLVFTNALDILSLSLLPFVRIGPIYQNVELGEISGEYNLYNLIDLSPPLDPILNAFDVLGSTVTRIRVTVKGVASPVDSQKLDIKFVRSAVEGVSLLGIDLSELPQLSARIPSSPTGFIDTIFIDDEMRIARAPPTPNAPQDGNYFVLLRE
jgi:hypothetical protein